MTRDQQGMASSSILCLSLLFFGGVGSGSGQQTRIDDDRPACRGCSIRLTQKVVLGEREGPGYIGRTLTLPRDSRGRYYVSSSSFYGEIKMYDSTGKYTGHLAHRGEGPGEVRSAPRMTITTDDSIHVFDEGRYSVFSPEGSYGRSVQLPFTVFFAEPVDEGFVVAARLGGTQNFSATLHTMDRSGNVLRSYGRERGNISAANSYVLFRQIGPGRNGTVWSATTFGGFSLEQWTPSGELLLSIARDPDWFEPKGKHAFAAWRPGRTKPPPMINAVREDEQGFVWVVSVVADPGWEQSDMRDIAAEKIWDSIIEVLDVVNGRVVARQRVDQYVNGFVGPDLYSYGETVEGYPEVVVWTTDLVGLPRTGGEE